MSRLPLEFAHIDLPVNNPDLALGHEPAQQAQTQVWAQMIAVNAAGFCDSGPSAGHDDDRAGTPCEHQLNRGTVHTYRRESLRSHYGICAPVHSEPRAHTLSTPMRVSVMVLQATTGRRSSSKRLLCIRVVAQTGPLKMRIGMLRRHRRSWSK